MGVGSTWVYLIEGRGWFEKEQELVSHPTRSFKCGRGKVRTASLEICVQATG